MKINGHDLKRSKFCKVDNEMNAMNNNNKRTITNNGILEIQKITAANDTTQCSTLQVFKVIMYTQRSTKDRNKSYLVNGDMMPRV